MLDTMELKPTIGLRVTFVDRGATREGVIVATERTDWGLRVIVRTDDVELIDVGLDQIGAVLSGDDGKTDA